jgi:hypothetical protein
MKASAVGAKHRPLGAAKPQISKASAVGAKHRPLGAAKPRI